MIRDYRESDRGQIMDLWDLFDRVHIDAMPDAFRQPSEEQRVIRHDKYAGSYSESPRPAYFMLVSEERGALNGFICGVVRDTPDAALLIPRVVVELHAVYVRNGFRKGKVSKELVLQALQCGKRRGATAALCHIWNFNAAARKHIERLGFRAVSTKYETSVT